MSAGMRKKTAKHPTHDCSNCGCKRYSPCGCMTKQSMGDADVEQALVEEETEGTAVEG